MGMHAMEPPHLTRRLHGFGTNVFTEMTQLALRHQAVNLGQGFPDFEGPETVREAAIEAIRGGLNQYVRTYGVPDLNRAIAEHQARFYDLDYDPETEVTVMNGATEVIFATFQALCEAGDEVVFFEPFYDSYRASVAMAGGKERVVTLKAPTADGQGFSYDPEDLERAVTPRTKALLINTPHNPTGRVFSRSELEHIADLCRRHDILAISDEVYEHLVFEGEHIPLATLPGMRDRTVTISSTGKTFSFTGWKIGYACAPPDLSRALRTAHQFINFCNGGPFQVAMAHALRLGDEYYTTFLQDYRQRRDHLRAGLAEAGFGVLPTAGTYFTLADIRPLGFDDDVEFCRWLPATAGVAAVPPTAFYVNKAEGRHLTRFAFCKSFEVLDAAVERLRKVRHLAGQREPGVAADASPDDPSPDDPSPDSRHD